MNWLSLVLAASASTSAFAISQRERPVIDTAPQLKI
jgi:hypothetical protein